MESVLIQGINCTYRSLRESSVTEDGELIEGEEILYANLPQDEQYFRRVESPFTDEDLVEISTVEYELRKGMYNKVQLQWVDREESRMTYGNGVYAMINGVLTYIPASYWAYVNHWVLEHGEKPEYREADRIFFLFMEYICFETEVLGITRGKGRRQGATSIGFFWMWWICGRLPEKRGGSISMNDDAAKKNFQGMFMRGFKGMLPCFVRDFDSKAENFVRFIKPADKAAKGVVQKREGLNSYCDFLSTTLNSYDSGRLSFLLSDESGKYEKMDINTYWSKVSPTLRVGRKKVGFAYLPTTVNPKNKGGEDYEKFWKEANQNEINPNTGEPYGLNTRHRVVRYFVPAYEGYAGCIDKFGASVIDDPKEPVMGNDGDWITEGAKTVIEREGSLKEGEQKMEFRRDFPVNEFDMFAFAAGVCEFNEENIQAQIKWVEDNPSVCYWRQLRLNLKKEIKESIAPVKGTKKETEIVSIHPMDDLKGGWFVLEYPQKENHFLDRNGYKEPLNESLYQIGVDTTQDRVAVAGSNPAITVFKKSCLLMVDGQLTETGLYPVAFWVSPTRMDIHFDEEVKKACLWFGCKANYEIDRRTDFYRYFYDNNCHAFLTWTPKIMQNPLKPNKLLEYGSRSGDPFQLAQMLQISKWYMDGDSQEVYNGHVHRVKFIPLLKEALHYDHLDRTKSDLFVSLQMALVAVFGEMRMPKKATVVPMKIMPTYKLKTYY